MNLPSISIIVPIYQVEPYIEDCLRSVVRQTYPGRLECILVDDCGTDRSMEKAARLISGYGGPIVFKTLHHACNRGLSAARNTGTDAATGDYIFFLDSDDVMTDQCIETLAAPLADASYDLVAGDLTTIGSDRLLPVLRMKLPHRTILRGEEILAKYRTEWNMLAYNKLYKAALIKDPRLKFMEGIIHEDELWSFQVACLATSLFAIRSVTYLYRIRPGGLSSLSTRKEDAAWFSIILKEIVKFTDTNGIYNESVCKFIVFMFYKTVNFHSDSFLDYKATYLQLVSLAKRPMKDLIHLHGFHIKEYLKNMHFFLPRPIAPYWQFYVLERLRQSSLFAG